VIEFAAKMGWRGLDRVPLPVVPVPDAEWLTVEELEQLLAVASPTWRLPYLIGARAGLRRGEIAELRWQDVDLGRGVIRVARAYKRGDDGVWTVGPTKGGRPRSIRIPPDLQSALATVEGRRGDLVVRGVDGGRISPAVFSEQVARDAARAGIGRPGIGAHALRHSYCSHLALGAAPVTVIQAVAGHSSLRTTQRYMHLAPSDVEHVIDHLPALGGR
jgi:integrase